MSFQQPRLLTTIISIPAIISPTQRRIGTCRGRKREPSIVLDFDGNDLKQRLSSLPAPKLLAFMLLLCERMTPQVREFAEYTGFDIGVYRECVELGWSSLLRTRDRRGYEDLAKICIDKAPDTEDFQHDLTSSALDAALSVADLMSFLFDGKVDHIVEAASWARDTAFMSVESTISIDDPALALQEINGHPLVQRELKQQEQDVSFIESLPEEIGEEAFSALRARAEGTPAILAK